MEIPPPLPQALTRLPRRVSSDHLSLRLRGPGAIARPGHWLAPLANVLNAAYHEPEVVEAVLRGDPAPISNQGMVLCRVDGVDGVDPEVAALFLARTGRPLPRDSYFAAPAWLPSSNYVPRKDLLQLLSAQVSLYRARRFPWLFSAHPCALSPADGERGLVEALEARADRWGDELLQECAALGITGIRSHPSKRAALQAWGLARLSAIVDATVARQVHVSDRERWQALTWSARAGDPPVSLRWFLDGVQPPDGVSAGLWLGACEAIWQRLRERPVIPGARGEWVAEVLGRRVALCWAVEAGAPLLTGWRAAGPEERMSPLLAEVDQPRETEEWRGTCRLFVSSYPQQDRPTEGDLRYLRWLAAAWGEVEAGLGTAREAEQGPRRAMLLHEAQGAGLLEWGRREALRAVLDAEGHSGLLRLYDATESLLAYLKSPERRARVGIGPHFLVSDAWVSPLWFLQDRAEARDFAFTAACEAALHGRHLGAAPWGEVESGQGVLRWRRDLGLTPALCAVR